MDLRNGPGGQHRIDGGDADPDLIGPGQHPLEAQLHSQDAKALGKSLRVLRAGGRLVSISGPPDPAFAEEIGASWFVKLVPRLLSFGVRRKARSLDTGFSFLFMRASSDQLCRITALVDAGAVRPVLDKVFPFHSTNEALAYVETGRARGKVVIKVK